MANKEDGILLSEEHGLNPSLIKCWLCGEDTGEIALLGKLPNDEKAPPYIVQKGHLCDRCKKALEEGNQAIIEVEDISEGKETPDNPDKYRTGRMVIVKKGKGFNNSPISYMEQSLFKKYFDEFLVEN